MDSEITRLKLAVRDARRLAEYFGLPAADADLLVDHQCPGADRSLILGRVQAHAETALHHLRALLGEINIEED